MDLTIETLMWIVFGAITLFVVLFALIFGFRRTFLQSGVRLGVLIVTVIVCAILTAVATTIAINYAIEFAQNGELGSNEIMNELLKYLSSEGVAAQDLKQVVAAVIAPFVFVALFIVLNLVTFIIYAIVTACTISQGHKKRKAKHEGEKYKASGLNRLGSLGVNLVTCFAFAALLLMPVTFYSQLGASVLTEVVATTEKLNSQTDDSTSAKEYVNDAVAASSKISEVNFNDNTEMLVFYKDVLTEVSANPFGGAYTAVGGLVSDNVTRLNTSGSSEKATSVTLKDFVEGTYPVLNSVIEITNGNGLENLSASTIYDIANSIKDNAFADELLGGLLSDAATSWSSGETFFGYSREDLGENGIIDSICEVLSNNANASEALLAVGHVYSVAQVMNLVGNTTDGTQSTEDVMTDLMSNLTDDSIDIVQKLVSETLTTAIGNQGADLTDDQLSKISEFVGDLLKELKKVQDGGNEEEIKKEATAVSTVFDAVKTAKSMTEDEARDLVVSVKDSTVLINSLDKFVADNPNPLNIETSDELKEQISKALDSLEITPDDKVYNIVMKFFGLEI